MRFPHISPFHTKSKLTQHGRLDAGGDLLVLLALPQRILQHIVRDNCINILKHKKLS